MREYNIRELKEKEIKRGIKVLYSSFCRTITGNQINIETKNWKMLMENGFGRFLISELEGNIIGIGGVFLFEDVCSFGYMGVLPHYRGEGIGTQIFGNLFEIAVDLGCKKMILYASTLGEPIYKKFGFLKSYYGSMYLLPRTLPKLGSGDKKVKVLNHLPNWLLDLDKETTGFDKAEYFKLKLDLGSMVLVVENEAFGFVSKVLTNLRLGPLISKNLDSALKIIKKSIALKANQIIITEHKSLPKKILELVGLTKVENGSSLRMTYGDVILENLDLIYAIGTFAKS
ncbi:MAG: GNAT family N-acetyltransferase [Candidatus Hodarchaeota archaeon]